MERLEPRRLMVVDVAMYFDGTAVVFGDDWDNEVHVYSWGVEVVDQPVPGLNSYWLSPEPINTVYALLGDGDDFLEMHVDARLFAYGGSGNDTIIGAGGADRIYGQLGSDTISGGAGNDFLIGDAGDDTITGGAGTDYLVGGFGSDTLIANDGEPDTVDADEFDLLTIDLLLDTVL